MLIGSSTQECPSILTTGLTTSYELWNLLKGLREAKTKCSFLPSFFITHWATSLHGWDLLYPTRSENKEAKGFAFKAAFKFLEARIIHRMDPLHLTTDDWERPVQISNQMDECFPRVTIPKEYSMTAFNGPVEHIYSPQTYLSIKVDFSQRRNSTWDSMLVSWALHGGPWWCSNGVGRPVDQHPHSSLEDNHFVLPTFQESFTVPLLVYANYP